MAQLKVSIPRASIGGASGDGGVEYRRAVAAYAVAHALAGEALPEFGFALTLAQVVAVAIETDEHADDVRVTLAGGHKAQVQAKRTLRSGRVLRSAVAQWRDAAMSGLDVTRDRLVLVTGAASGTVRTLARALDRCKTDEPGAFTGQEKESLKALDQMLSGLTSQQRRLVRRCAVITILDVEEEQSSGANLARYLLGRVLGGGDVAVRAWRDLVAHCGRVGRLRGGFGVEGWVRLLQEEGYRVAGYGTPAADVARQAEALDRYRDLLRSRGTMVDLRPLGADTPPVPLAEVDSVTECVPAGADEREVEPLPWSLLRRRRVLLTGLPGGGKSVTMSAAAAVLVDAAGAPLPLVVSLRDVDARDRSSGFADRVLDTAVKDVPAIDRPLVRAALEHGLRSGATALLLDSLDETHDRRGTVVSEIENLCGGISADVPVLLATRDVAYAQAATLGWDDLRLVKPKEPKRAVRAVLAAVAAARQAPDSDAWVERRVEWVAAILDRDRVLGETALMPVLLALLAGDRSTGALPVTRAEILHGVVEAAVRRREAHRDPGVRLATLNEHDSANATLAAFAVEAGVLGDAGGQARLATVQEAVATALIRDWGLPSGAAASSARAIVHFWDEIGVFVIRGADEIIAPRMELFLDIGDAVQASKRPPEAVAAWVDARIHDRRHEPLILAAAMSDIACEKLVTAACDSGEHELLIAASTAVRQHARISHEGRVRLAAALTKDAASPDRQGWTSYVAMLGLVSEYDTLRDTGEVLAQYPLEHQVIAKAAIVLRASSDSADNEALLNTLHTNRLRPLPDRDLTAASAAPWTLGDDLYDEVIEAVARRLLSHMDEATGLIVEMLKNASIGLRKRLLRALRDAGFDDEVNDIFAQEAREFKRTLEWLKDHDREGEVRVLDHLAHLSCAAELDVTQAARLDELAALITSLRLDVLSAWPRREAYSAWLEFVDVILTLGGFDLARISAEAAIMQRRVAQCGIRAFAALDIASERRRLVRWHAIDTPEVAARSLAKALFMGRATSFVAAAALSTAPPDIAVPLLEDALPRLQSLRDNQHFAALALSLLKHDEPLREWAVSDQVELRRVAAMRLPNVVNGELNSLLCQLTHDKDNRVADAAVRNVGDVRTKAAVEHLKSIASTERGKWTCLHCGSPHADIVDCMAPHISLPDPARTAHDILAECADFS